MDEKLMQQLQEIAKQRESIEAQVKLLRQEAIEEVQQLINTFGLQASCFRFPNAPAASAAPRSAAKPKYRDPATGKTWTGRGREPIWMRRALENGKTKDDFLIRE